MATLYSLPHSPYSARCRIAIYYKELEIDIVPPKGGLRSSDYHAIVPTKKVPALITETSTLVESSAILEYLDECFPTPSLRSSSAEGRAVQRALISFTDFSIASHIFPLFKAIMSKTDPSTLDSTVDMLKSNLQSLERMFIQEGRSINDLDLADCALAPSLFYALHLADQLGLAPLFGHTPTLQIWWKNRSQIPAVAKALTEVEQGLNAFLKAFSSKK